MTKRKDHPKKETTQADAELFDPPPEVPVSAEDVRALYPLAAEAPPAIRPRHCPRCGWGPASTVPKSRGGPLAVATSSEYEFECPRCPYEFTARRPRWREPK